MDRTTPALVFEEVPGALAESKALGCLSERGGWKQRPLPQSLRQRGVLLPPLLLGCPHLGGLTGQGGEGLAGVLGGKPPSCGQTKGGVL